MCEIDSMQNETAYTIHTAKVKKVKGKHALVLVFKSKLTEQQTLNLMNLEWFAFESESIVKE